MIMNSILNGLGVFVGFLFGMVFIVILLAVIKSIKGLNYDLPRLNKAFKIYRQKATEKEKYSELKDLDTIVKSLSDKTKPKELDLYNIKTDNTIKMKNKKFKIIKKYKISKK